MSYYNSETIAHFFFYGAILSIFLGIVLNYKIGVNVFFLTYIIPLITIPFALIHAVIYIIHIEYSHNLDNLIYWELIFYLILFLSYYIYSTLSKNYFYHFIASLLNGGFFKLIFENKNKEINSYKNNTHEENLKNLALKLEDSFSIFFRSTILFIYIYIVYFILKSEDRNLIYFFYFIDDITYGHEYIGLFIFSFSSSLFLALSIKQRKIQRFRKILDYINILRLEGKFVLFTMNDRTRLDFKLTDFDYEPHMTTRPYYYFLDFEDDGIWYFFHPKVDYAHFNHIMSATLTKPLSKFYSELKERNAESKSD